MSPTGEPRSSLSAVDIVRPEQREAFITADGSSIRELAGIPSGNLGDEERLVRAGDCIVIAGRCAQAVGR